MKKVLFMLLVMFALSACQSKDSLNAAKKVDKFLDGLKEGTK